MPWTTLRATQFHEFVLMAVQAAAKLPVLPVFGGFRFQPVDAGTWPTGWSSSPWASRSGSSPDIAGPEIHPMAGWPADYLRATGKHRLVLPVHVPGRRGQGLPGRRQPRPRPGRRHPHLGGVPGRASSAREELSPVE